VWGWARAVTYEWDQATDPNRVATSIKGSWRYPKSAYALYRSASQHTNRGQRPPLIFWVVPLAVIVVAVGGYKFKDHISRPLTPITPANPDKSAQRAGSVVGGPASVPALPVTFDLTPRLPGRPETAPAFDQVVKVAAAPTVVGCVASRVRCQCYTVQATPLAVPDAECRARAGGKVFDPYAEAQTYGGSRTRDLHGQQKQADKPDQETLPPIENVTGTHLGKPWPPASTDKPPAV